MFPNTKAGLAWIEKQLVNVPGVAAWLREHAAKVEQMEKELAECAKAKEQPKPAPKVA